jgi:hypothetical protein
MGELYASIQPNYLEKNKEAAKKRWLKEVDSTGATYYFPDEEGEIQEFNFENGQMNISIDTPLGFFSIRFTPDSNDYAKMITEVVKQFNKFKTAIEALK